MTIICHDTQFVPSTNLYVQLISEHQRHVYRKDIQLICTVLHHTLDCGIVIFLSSRSALIYFYPDQYINQYPVRDCEHNRADVSHLTFLYADMWYSEVVQRNHK